MGEILRIGFVGAGNVNFGGGEGPWDHASRLEKIGGLRVVGVADPVVERAEAQIRKRSNPLFKGAKAYGDFRDLIRETRPDALWIGVPPNAHGTRKPGNDIEIQCAAARVHLFIEKPLSALPPTFVRPVKDAISRSGVIVSVGYMFRYAQAVEQMRRILADTPGGAKAFVGRYNCAYSEIEKPEWWDLRTSGGPIVEQATHFIDLARYLCGEVDSSTVSTLTVRADEPAGQLIDMPLNRDGEPLDCETPEAFRIPRGTVAMWKFETGAVGSLIHGMCLHGKRYDTGLEVWGDGLQMVLEDPYGQCRLSVRRPHSETLEVISFEDDPYLTEDEVFVDAVRRLDTSGIRSPYGDALRTFELTWLMGHGSRQGETPEHQRPKESERGDCQQ